MNRDSSFLKFALANESPFEDGTNLRRGTAYVAEPSGKVLPWYEPSESTAPSNWKEKWSALRARFERLIDECIPVESVLVQSRIPAYGWKPEEALPHVQRHPTFLAGGGLHNEPARLYAPDWSEVQAAFPIKSVKGEPILNDAGKPVAYRLGAWRYYFVQPPIGRSPDVGALPVPRLSQLARDATNLLYELPGEIAVGVWRNWLSGFSKTRNSGHSLWIDALFELSWQQPPGGPLHSSAQLG